MLSEIEENTTAERQRWMSALANCDAGSLELAMAPYAQVEFTWLRRPETGLSMMRARVGGTGDRFNFGEVTLTRCALRLPGGLVGVAYIQGRSSRKAELAALADALLQDPEMHDELMRSVVEPAMRARVEEVQRMHRRAQSTRVEFLTVARETSA